MWSCIWVMKSLSDLVNDSEEPTKGISSSIMEINICSKSIFKSCKLICCHSFVSVMNSRYYGSVDTVCCVNSILGWAKKWATVYCKHFPSFSSRITFRITFGFNFTYRSHFTICITHVNVQQSMGKPCRSLSWLRKIFQVRVLYVSYYQPRENLHFGLQVASVLQVMHALSSHCPLK